MYGWQRAMRIFDGPDEVHIRSIARAEIGREPSAFAAAVTRAVTRRRQLSGAWNFRDVAETHRACGPAGSSGPVSSAVSTRPAGDAVPQLGITDVADLRSPQEVERRGPGAVPDGVDVHLLPFPDLSNTPTARHRTRPLGRR